MNSKDYLLKAKEMLECSDNQLAIQLNITRQAMSALMNDKARMSDYTASQVAEIVGVPAMELIALVNEEKAKDETEKAYWVKKRKGVRAKAVAVLALTIALGTSKGFQTSDGQSVTGIKDAPLRITYILVNLGVIFRYFICLVWHRGEVKKRPALTGLKWFKGLGREGGYGATHLRALRTN